MEYFLGSLLTIIAFVVTSFVIKTRVANEPIQTIRYSQSHVFELVRFMIPSNKELKSKALKTQATVYEAKATMRVVFVEDKAYWIKDNTFFHADVVAGEILKETTKEVDTMSMDRVQLDKMAFIVDRLTEGINDDRSNSGF